MTSSRAGTSSRADWRFLVLFLAAAAALAVTGPRPSAQAPLAPHAPQAARPQAASSSSSSSSASSAAVSAPAQRAYSQARAQLVQVRTLLQGQDSQSSVGSGFVVSDEGHIITNYHVVSEVALQPKRYRLVFSTVERTEGPLQLLAFDVLHDLALVKPAAPGALAGRPPLRFRPRAEPLTQGERIYSLGNPLDVGFAVVEGTYNGLVERSFYPTIFFSGSLNPGVSGGPTLDDRGQVVGINVAARWDGEQVSFLVPAPFAEDLLQRARNASPITKPVYREITAHLLTHQEALTSRFLAKPWRNAGHAKYVIPLPEEQFMRCWGDTTPIEAKGLEYELSRCGMHSAVFVFSGMRTGALTIQHQAYDGRKIGMLRFADRYSQSFANESVESQWDTTRTAAQCHERYIDRNGLPMRAVLCMRAYKKFPGLYDLSVLVATIDDARAGVQGRFDATGVSFDNALKLSEHYLEGFQWTPTQTGAAR